MVTLPLGPRAGHGHSSLVFGSMELGLEWTEYLGLHPKNTGSVNTGSCQGFVLQLSTPVFGEKHLVRSPAESLETPPPQPLT